MGVKIAVTKISENIITKIASNRPTSRTSLRHWASLARQTSRFNRADLRPTVTISEGQRAYLGRRMTDWAIPQQAKLKYTQLFNLHDRTRSGFLSGLQCRDILLQSGLPRNVLAEIWNLSDIDGDGQLTREEFILALYLTNNVRSGQALPSELPPDLVPPSYRRARSTSTTSVNSATSLSSSLSGPKEEATSQKPSDSTAPATTPASIFNSNSFEDKRRENFVKGKAELERRRLRIIDEQLELLGDRVNSFKSQVADVKAKIDSMRPERDSKMGLITSLEAQLKTLQDRKAYLHQEEISLIAIAQDLNLINPAQAELNQLAVEAKKQDIDKLQRELEAMSEEKENKSKELAEASKQLEKSRIELKSLSQSVSQVYNTYKEKIENAKTIREQIVEENKSKTLDLDSVWGSEPVFAPQVNDTLVPAGSNQSANDDFWSTKTTFDDPSSAFSELSLNNNNNKDLFGGVKSSPPSSNEPPTKLADRPLPGLPEFSNFKKKYRALYAFEERNLDELTINPGDIITGSDQVCEPGWLSGELNGRIGLFPEAYVEPIDDEDKEANITNLSDITSSLHISSASAGVSEQQDHQQFPLPASAIASTVKYKTLFSFEARSSDELTINPGDIVLGLGGNPEPGWLLVELNGHKGLIPESYVERIADTQLDQDQAGTAKTSSKRAEVATVIANYRALGQEQLNLEKGQLVLIRRKMDSGWWEGEVQVKGKKKQFGWFPASYVKLLSRGD